MAVYRFGPFDLDTRTGELRKQRQRVRLRPQPSSALVYLIERHGQFVGRRELHKALWPEGTFVRFEDGLNSCIKQIRGALEDSRTEPSYIETLTRRGYRFIAPVTVLSDLYRPDPHGRALVCILPVRDLEASSTRASLTEGVREELVAQLAGAAPRHLAVVASRGGADGSIGLDDVGADYALAVTLRTDGSRLRATAQLTETRTRQHAWAGRFDFSLEHPLETESALADRIVRAVVTAIQEADHEDVTRGHHDADTALVSSRA